jgi:hypothetical protein
MFGKAITYKTTKKCLADNRTAKYEASVGPAKNLPPSVRRISKTLLYRTRDEADTQTLSWGGV